MLKKVRIGVLGVGRGRTMIRYCEKAQNAQVVAICDKWKEGLEAYRKKLDDPSVTFYDNFDEFIRHDMDAVVLANYANEHAPFAIRCMEAGKHVFSEVLPAQTMKEAVELIECVERTGKIYAYGENYCYMPAPREMRRIYRSGALGEFTYGEGEYIHNRVPIWPDITYGDPDHWRNHMYATFYCTHSIGPLVHITGLRPVSVVGFETPFDDRNYQIGCKSGCNGIEMLTMENGGVVRSVHGSLARNSIWYSIYGSRGTVESAREITQNGDVSRIYTNYGWHEGDDYDHVMNYTPNERLSWESRSYGHGGSDFFTMYNFAEKVLGNPDAEIIDVYEAMDMFLPGLFAYRSILAGNNRMDIPDLRKKSEREKWRNDTFCTDPKVAGDMLVPSYSKGDPEIPQEIYDKVRRQWEHNQEVRNNSK